MNQTDGLREQWQAAWPRALAAWSRHIQLRPPLLCLQSKDAAREGLTESFAMIRLQDQSVVIDLERVRRDGLEDYAVEILAHEIGHHVLAPANLSDHARSLARIRKALPTLEAYAPMVANLYTDLMINDRLQRSAELRLSAVFRQLQAESSASQSKLWTLYQRMYELLWSLPRGELTGAARLSDQEEGDAWLGMRIVRHFARDWLSGAGMFASLLLPYLVGEAQEDARMRAWHDTRVAGAGGEPAGLTDMDPQEGEPVVHPSRDPRITGTDGTAPVSTEPKESPITQGSGQTREPYEYGEILRASGITLSDEEIAVRYYREKAAPFLVRFPARVSPRQLDELPEGLEPWAMGEPLDAVDWMQSIFTSPNVVPGMTTVQRMWGVEEGVTPKATPLDLDVYIDSSGSMANPQRQLSYPTLAGAILCLSALRAGARVQVTVWSGKEQCTSTPGFVREPRVVLNTLVAYFGGATQFPLHVLRETYLGRERARRPAHVLVISDDGVTTMFDKDERGTDGYDLLRSVLSAADGGATFVLNLFGEWASAERSFAGRDTLVKARDELRVHIYTIRDWSELVSFARKFAADTYSSHPEKRSLEVRS